MLAFEYEVTLDVFVSSQFEQENQRLIGEMNSLFDEVRYVCGSSELLASAFLEARNFIHLLRWPGTPLWPWPRAPLSAIRGSRQLPDFSGSPDLVGPWEVTPHVLVLTPRSGAPPALSLSAPSGPGG